ncbi:MAG: cation:proton antiporter [Bdellovibrionaceae bacterium]|nr:cation:proton antiporter [Pseudobdellovibrionaceae bacterium]
MIHLAPLIRDLAFLLLTAASTTLIFRWLRLPMVVGYLVAGIFLGPHFPWTPNLVDLHSLEVWAEIGVIFLLFGLGLEFSYRRLRSVGRGAFITGSFEMILMFSIGYLTGRLLGFQGLESLFLGGAMAISSSSIVVRSVSELKLKGRRFVHLVYGVLIVEDLVAIILLVLLGALAQSDSLAGSQIVMTFLRLVFFLVAWFVAGTYLIPIVLRKLRPLLTGETTLIVSVGLCLMMVYAATEAGFSSALGAFLMGSILAGTPEGHQIEEKISSLKDLFSSIFFVSIGMLIDLSQLWSNFGTVVAVTLTLIIGKFIAVGLGSLLAGQSYRHSVQTATAMAQIGEFSFLMAKLGQNYGVLSDQFFPLVVLVSALSSFVTPFLLKSSDQIVTFSEPRLPAGLKNALLAYQRSLQSVSTKGGLRLIWQFYGMKMMINTVVIVGITILMRRVVHPLVLNSELLPLYGTQVFMVSATLLLCLPFFWAMVLGKPGALAEADALTRQKLKSLNVGLFLFRSALTLFLLIFLVNQFLSSRSVTWMLLGLTIAMSLMKSRIEKAYRRIEAQFLDHLNERELKEMTSHAAGPALAPWDAQLVEIKISADAPVIGHTLMESKLKEDFGITIALIERGGKKILAPQREERLYPSDKLFVIGNEDQVLKARAYLEAVISPVQGDLLMEFGLDSFQLSPVSKAVGKNIRECGLREDLEALIVGIERSGQRILNPDSGLILQAFDIVWVVGSRQKVKNYKFFEETRLTTKLMT